MPRLFALTLCFAVMGGAAALGQETPVETGPMGTPMTPAQVGAWVFAPAISKAEAEQDAQDQGFPHVTRLRMDDYGDWIGQSEKGALIIFPDGHAYPF